MPKKTKTKNTKNYVTLLIKLCVDIKVSHTLTPNFQKTTFCVY